MKLIFSDYCLKLDFKRLIDKISGASDMTEKL